MKHIYRLFSLALLVLLITADLQALRKPRLTVIFVVDQFAYSYLPKLSPFMHGGIKHLIQHGVFYKNAYYPHAMPSTAPGHTALNTGAYAKDHGIIANNWYDQEGNKILPDDDSVKNAAVFSPNGLYNYGKSAHKLMTDGISDQFVLSQQPCEPRYVFSVSLKSRSAIMTVGKLGKALWFDTQSGGFTSSKAYFNELPQWVTRFNNEECLKTMTNVRWDLFYKCTKAPYCFKEIYNYEFSDPGHSMIGVNLPINRSSKDPYELFMRTPAANQMILDLSLRCINTHLTRCGSQEMILWVCLSPLDLVGHDFGPQSLEATDIIYHLDCQIKQFMNQVTKRLKRRDVLFVLTADHGISPIPEILHQEGLYSAHRISTTKIAEQVNQMALKKYGIKDVAIDADSSQFFLRGANMKELSQEKRNALTKDIEAILSSQPGIKKVWGYEELQKSWFLPDQIESFYKNQTFPDRSAPYIIQPYPYCPVSQYKKGASHRTPYEPDTHVPLILYQKSNLEKQVIYDHVWTLQLANTLAHILGVQKPSSSTFSILPGVISYDPLTGEVLETVSSPCPCH